MTVSILTDAAIPGGAGRCAVYRGPENPEVQALTSDWVPVEPTDELVAYDEGGRVISRSPVGEPTSTTSGSGEVVIDHAWPVPGRPMCEYRFIAELPPSAFGVEVWPADEGVTLEWLDAPVTWTRSTTQPRIGSTRGGSAELREATDWIIHDYYVDPRS